MINFITRLLKHGIFFTLVLITSTGCQNTIETAGLAHKTTVEMWQELSRYSSSHLLKHGLYVSAKLEATEDASAPYRLSKIHLALEPSYFYIDLLKPEFEQKYICNPVCKQLTEYEEKEQKGSTLLTQFFELHKYELFDFYAELALLNDQVKKQGIDRAPLYPAFLTDVVEQGKAFDNLAELSAYLKSTITTEALQAFRNKPPLFELPIREEQAWANGAPGFPPEQAMWKTEEGIPPEQLVWNKSGTSTDWLAAREEGTNSQASKNSGDSSVKQDLDWLPPEMMGWLSAQPIAEDRVLANNWKLAQLSPFSEKDTVCSFDENLFAVVKQINGEKITVETLGQAKVITDGIITNADPGLLFNEEATEVTFEPLRVTRKFLRNQLAECTIQR